MSEKFQTRKACKNSVEFLVDGVIFFEVIKELHDQYEHVAIFAHNPGITDFANRLCKDVSIDEMPTCSIFAVESTIEKWSNFKEAEKKFLFFDSPKN